MIKKYREWLNPPAETPGDIDKGARRHRIIAGLSGLIAAGCLAFGGASEIKDGPNNIGTATIFAGATLGIAALSVNVRASKLQYDAQAWRRELAFDEASEVWGAEQSPEATPDKPRISADVLRAIVGADPTEVAFKPIANGEPLPELPPESDPTANGEA